MDEFQKMRGLIRLVEITDYSEPVIEFQEEEPVVQDKSMKDDLADLIAKLNDHYESEDSEKSLGIELGMQRAAEMIENLLKKYTESEVG